VREPVGGLLPNPAVTAEAHIASFSEPENRLFHEELEIIAGAVPKRRREFAVSRILARMALRRLGVSPVPVLTAEDRAPIWPSGIVGTISHTSGYCAVSVAHSCVFRSIGIDVEIDRALPCELRRLVCRPEELGWTLCGNRRDQGRRAMLLFSIKESIYKAQYPRSRTFLDFQAFEVCVDVRKQEWQSTLAIHIPSFPAGTIIRGSFAYAGGLVATAAWIPTC
jgi:4'-phosphopantetheinyl transferase EntD